jgi:hypothetical protein
MVSGRIGWQAAVYIQFGIRHPDTDLLDLKRVDIGDRIERFVSHTLLISVSRVRLIYLANPT